ncbi:MAG: hypothetical protein EA419_12290 [Wenzhouxiangella sp.]|nr:MAG: hypothetical protein EA419_12290 [Wenzhouxiangella sp.]
MSNKKTLLACLMAAALPFSAWSAGGHYPVDDADIGDPGDFGIETWFTHVDSDNSELAFLPTWRPGTLPVELVLGLIRVEEDSDSFNRVEPAAKWQFSPIAPGRLGAAVNVEGGFDDGDWTDLLVNFPLSYELPDAPVVVHANLGWIHDRAGDDNVDRLFSGAAFEWGLNDRADLIGQVYREGADEEVESQLGLRFHFDHNVEYLDLAAGRTLTGDDKDWFFTVGFGLAF